MKKQIAHEVPLSLLEQSRQFNTYDYALVHLFEKHPEYYNFFADSMEMGREIILDNSIFELGEAFDMDKFAGVVDQLRPTQYIIPDVLENCDETIDNIERWLRHYSFLPGVKIGVVQGGTYEEVVKCYKYIERHCDKIAISFDYAFFKEMAPSDNKFESWMKGRQMLMRRLLDDQVIDLLKPHHLLGCGLPQEFIYYQHSDFDFIESIDTSNPVVHGLLQIRYKQGGLMNKQSIKLADLIESSVSEDQLEIILHNVQLFNTFVNG